MATDTLNIKELLSHALYRKASDLHLISGLRPMLRVDGFLIPSEYPELDPNQTKKLVYSLLTDKQKEIFEMQLELDAAVDMAGMARFRLNVHVQKGNVEAAFRVIPNHIRTLEELGLPPIVADLARRPTGLVLVTGPTGMGKTTTLSAMVDLINRERQCLIVGIEDPVEYLHAHNKSVVKQREVGSDTHSFASALKHVLRQDPNVILVGEMRDLETMSIALRAAETGHFILSTLHTPDVPQTIDRIIDVFPPHQQEQVRTQLSNCLQGIICQQLLPRKDGNGRVVACEVLTVTSAARNLIRNRKTEQLSTIMQTGEKHGMITMDRYLKNLYQAGII
ncbi:MAG: type IV pilus twitching motility protein PilT, partial [Smithellaceae bacterium]|nr:type IV pilus twitching motility protein PilT [Smithellaceae bacterium]